MAIKFFTSDSLNTFIDEIKSYVSAALGNKEDKHIYLTQAEYDAIGDEKLTNGKVYHITDSGISPDASTMAYDNSDSGLEARNVQDAVDEIALEKVTSYGVLSSVDLFEWALAQTTSCTFMIKGGTVTNVPDDLNLGSWYRGVLNVDGSDRGILLYYSAVANPGVWVISTYASTFDGQSWVKFATTNALNSYLPLTGGTLSGDIYVKNGLARFTSTANSAQMIAYHGDVASRSLQIVNHNYTQDITTALRFQNKNEDGTSKVYEIFGEHNMSSFFKTDVEFGNHWLTCSIIGGYGKLVMIPYPYKTPSTVTIETPQIFEPGAGWLDATVASWWHRGNYIVISLDCSNSALVSGMSYLCKFGKLTITS